MIMLIFCTYQIPDSIPEHIRIHIFKHQCKQQHMANTNKLTNLVIILYNVFSPVISILL